MEPMLQVPKVPKEITNFIFGQRVFSCLCIIKDLLNSFYSLWSCSRINNFKWCRWPSTIVLRNLMPRVCFIFVNAHKKTLMPWIEMGESSDFILLYIVFVCLLQTWNIHFALCKAKSHHVNRVPDEVTGPSKVPMGKVKSTIWCWYRFTILCNAWVMVHVVLASWLCLP